MTGPRVNIVDMILLDRIVELFLLSPLQLFFWLTMSTFRPLMMKQTSNPNTELRKDYSKFA